MDLMKKHEINKAVLALNRKLYEKQLEAYETQLMIAATPTDEDLKPYVDQFDDKMKTLNAKNEKERQKLRDREEGFRC